MRPLITAGATKKGVIARKKKKYKKKSVPRTGFFNFKIFGKKIIKPRLGEDFRQFW